MPRRRTAFGDSVTCLSGDPLTGTTTAASASSRSWVSPPQPASARTATSTTGAPRRSASIIADTSQDQRGLDPLLLLDIEADHRFRWRREATPERGQDEATGQGGA